MTEYLTITDAAAGLRAGDVTSVELVPAAVAGADRSDAELGTFISRYVDQSLAAAASADAALAAGAAVGALHGIPLGIKDIITTSEGPTTAQSVAHDPISMTGDAVVVARLRAAGGIITGKTSTMEYACGLPDATKPFPYPRNPWDPQTWSGGSSSGTGSGIAAGMFLGGLGTDTGGSIRIPSTFCGITGLMPTFGRVPKSGCVPLGYSLDHIGPMARSAADCALMLSVLAGHDASDLCSIDVPVDDYVGALTGDLSGLTIGIDRLSRVIGEDADPALGGLLDDAVAALAGLGATVVELEIPYYVEMIVALGVIAAGETLAYHLPDAQARLGDYVASNRIMLPNGTRYSGADYVQAQRARRIGQRALAGVFQDVDLVLTPTASGGALPFEDLGVDLMSWFGHVHTPYWDVVGNPVISAPAGFSAAGLPIGIQLAGRPFDEATVLRAADAFQRVTDHHLQRPALVGA
jgi:aspartyl-tRNA(Asn)/glutamyl-tRNA(Gln) amidotransferase subunit A